MKNYVDSKLYLEDVKKVALDSNLDFSKLSNKSILITGASGLICSFLVDVLMYRNNYFHDNITLYLLCRNEEKLKERFSYYNLSNVKEKENSNINYIVADVKDKFDFNIQFDYIIHGASNTHPTLYATDPIGTINTNILGLSNLLQYASKINTTRILVISSVEVYGENTKEDFKFKENDFGYINPNTLRAGYPESKRLCESLAQAYIEQEKLDIVIARLPRVYGPTLLKNDSKALSQFIRNAINNEDIILKSEGKQYFSYLYVADTVSAMLKILFDGKCSEAYNVSDDNSDIRLKDLAELLSSFNNKKVVFELPNDTEKKGFSKASIALLDSEKLKSLSWHSYYNIKEGLERTIKIIKELNK